LTEDEKKIFNPDWSLDIKFIQKKLKGKGLYEGTVDGITGKNTTNAIKNLQLNNHLEQTGDIDIDTKIALLSCN
jgi:peptidoglycan hydrolase-like protein with peptidoglycan-binding domain